MFQISTYRWVTLYPTMQIISPLTCSAANAIRQQLKRNIPLAPDDQKELPSIKLLLLLSFGLAVICT